MSTLEDSGRTSKLRSGVGSDGLAVGTSGVTGENDGQVEGRGQGRPQIPTESLGQ